MRETKYFSNSKGKLRKKKTHLVELESTKGGRASLQVTWDELKHGLASGEFSYDDVSKLLDTRFIGVLSGLLEYEYNRKSVTVDLKYFARSKKFVRAAKVNSDDEAIFDRFIPKADKMKSGNRFSPKGFEWLYLGFDRHIGYAKKCCYAEVRANDSSNVKYCEFKHNGYAHNAIDLTIADTKSWEEILERKESSHSDIAYALLFEIYCKLLSEEIFKPVSSDNSELEYAPFQCMAQYFKSLGFDGIIYKSTVSDVGKNLVMFEKESFIPIEIS